MPQRLQRKRVKGWQAPPNAIYVGRPTRWGNPWRPGEYGSRAGLMEAFRRYAAGMLKADPHWLDELRGKDLLCWCATDESCHADILLELANQQER